MPTRAPENLKLLKTVHIGSKQIAKRTPLGAGNPLGIQSNVVVGLELKPLDHIDCPQFIQIDLFVD
jgi:hypothetical protein